MKFFFPDSQDLVDPSFDFVSEKRAATRERHRDDMYAHEVFSKPAYDGLLVSKGIVDGVGPSSGKYTLAQRHRLLRVGVREFFRLDGAPGHLPVIGDCGAFTYVREQKPPYSVDEVIDFYNDCRFDYGISVDHVILAFQPDWDAIESAVPDEVRERQSITLKLAEEFRTKCLTTGSHFEPIGVAQGWSPQSYAYSVATLQRMGYDYIALGGMVPLKSKEILACLSAIDAVRLPQTRLHLLGVTRVDHVTTFESHGVVSFDSTSPLRQAFKDEKDNYHTMDRTYTAIRVPQVEGNPSLQKRIRAGLISQERARVLERRSLAALEAYAQGTMGIEGVIDALRDYEALYDSGNDHSEAYRETLTDQPWKACCCDVCRALGYHVALFRGAERNRRRGFHNVWVFYRRLGREFGVADDRETSALLA
jgi:hypothetical protein